MRFDKDKVKTVLQKHWKRWFFGIVLPILLITFLSILQSVLMNFPSVGEAYAKSGFVFFSFLPAKISDLIPISLAEIFVVTLILSSPILIAWLVIRIRRAVKAGRGKKYFYNVGRVTAWGLFAIYLLFMLLHGLNYTRYSLDEELGFGKRTYTLEELQEVYAWVISSINETRPQCTEDENGVLSYPGGKYAFLSDMKDLYEKSAEKFPQIRGNAARPKPVYFSHYWSYTYIVGLYFPFFAEPNINVDVPFVEMAYNACHEMSHLHGYAVENDANLAGLLIALESDCPELRYSGYYESVGLIIKDLQIAYNKDREALSKFLSQYPVVGGYFRDYTNGVSYWETIDPPKIVEDVSNATNDAYLKANKQKDGVKSYNMPTSTVADYYFTYVKGQE